jgi:hypothetical protein
MKNIILLLALCFQLTAQNIVKVEKIDNTTFKIVTDKGLTKGKNYEFKVIEQNINYSENDVIVITPPTPTNPTLPTCENEGNFSISSAGYGNNAVDFKFNAKDLTEGKFEINKDNQVIKNGTFKPTSNVVVLSTGTLEGGNYTLKIIGVTCTGQAVKTFSISQGNQPPTGLTEKNVLITEPPKPPFYFSNGLPPNHWENRNNLPAIFTNGSTYDEVNDVVWMNNGILKIGINLKRGGQLCSAGFSNSSENYVYNGGDGGFQWVYDGTTDIVGGIINGQQSSSPQNNINYNVTMGGTWDNRATSLKEYGVVDNSYVVKFRPLLYPFKDIISEVELETTYTLIGDFIKIDYKYIQFRSDPHVRIPNPNASFVIPVMFVVNQFDRYMCYEGNDKWTNAPLRLGEIPNATNKQGNPIGFNNPELWGAVWNPNTNVGIGVYNPTGDISNKWCTFEQMNKHKGSDNGTVFTGPYTVMSLYDSVTVPDGRNFTKESTVYICLKKNKDDLRQAFYDLHNRQ